MYRAVTKCILSRGDPVLHQIQPATLSPSTLINLESVDSVNDLKNYIHNYPYSVAAKLDYLYAVNKTQIQEQLSDDFVQEITQLELPEKWKTWVSDLSLKGFITKPPCPFPTISRRESIC